MLDRFIYNCFAKLDILALKIDSMCHAGQAKTLKKVIGKK